VWWGRDWISPIDEMHYQLNFREGDARLAELASDLQNGYLGIWTAQFKRHDLAPVAGAVVLEVGDEGEKVRKLQERLNREFPQHFNLEEDGVFGPKTQEAVEEFQRRAGILVDGVAGPITLEKLGLTF
jgi:murein L,D-transpeptidase YcbB/YkuD